MNNVFMIHYSLMTDFIVRLGYMSSMTKYGGLHYRLWENVFYNLPHCGKNNPKIFWPFLFVQSILFV